MRKLVSVCGVLAIAAILPTSSEAAAIALNPSSPGMIGAYLDPANCEPECVETALGLPAGTLMNPDDLLYKANFGGPEEGAFAASYGTAFSPATDPTDATITYAGAPAPTIACPNCYLVIKDGQANPNWYFYNLAAWDGMMDIVLTGFFAKQDPNCKGKGCSGAISHVSIWGFPAEGEEEGEEEGGAEEEGSTIPEPASVLLIGLGMAAAASRLRQRKA